MNRQPNQRYLLPILLRFILYFSVSAFAVLTALVSLEFQKFTLERSKSQDQEALRLVLTSRALQHDLHFPIKSVRTLAGLHVVSEYVRDETETNRMRVEQAFVNFSHNSRLYDQIRYIDPSGREQLRVSFQGQVAKAVPRSQLQDKSQRYYFREALRLKAKAIYISPLDLNIEAGQIERPLKPTIRLATPVFDATGQLHGIIVLNYLAEALLDDFREFTAGSWGKAMLVNPQGFWLASYNPEDEWGFMLGRKETFAARYPQAWDDIIAHESGAVQTAAGLFIYATLRPYTANSHTVEELGESWLSERYWKIISWVSPQALNYSPLLGLKERPYVLTELLLLVCVLSIALAWLRTKYTTKANALRASEERFRVLFEQAPDGIFVANIDGRYSDVNSSGSKMLGYEHDEIVGKTIGDLLPPADIDRLWQSKDQLLQGGIQVAEWRLRRKDNTYLPVEVSAKILPDGHWQGFVRDISRRKEAEKQLHEYREQLEDMVAQRTAALEASNIELEAFSYSIAHDLRTPLRSITSFSQILQQEAESQLTEQQRQDLQRIIKAGKYMAQLIDDILGLARISRTKLVIETVDLSYCAKTIIEKLKQTYPQRSVQVDIAPNIKCQGDSSMLSIALENLLGNAWKYTSKRVDAYIVFGAMDKDNTTVYYVRDNGVGFNMHYVHKLFAPFQRLHTLSEFEGTGIGLASVARVVKRHNGEVWAEAKEGEGATFYFTLHAVQSND